MLIERISVLEGEKIAASLANRQTIPGTYFLLPRPEDPTRYYMTPALHEDGQFTVMTGRDSERGWITLFQNKNEAVVMLKATTAALS